MSSRGKQAELPGWVMPVVVAIGVLIVAIVAWRALAGGGATASGPDKEVHAGMYDFKKEAASGNLGRRTGSDTGIPP